MSRHTKEPWMISAPQSGYITSPSDDYQIICAVHEWEEDGALLQKFKNSEANARRIVACVNACAGLSTESLENTSGLNELYGDMQKERDVQMSKRIIAEQQRDELLEALYRAIPFVEDHLDDGRYYKHGKVKAVVQYLKQAIKNAEGGK